MTSTDLHHPDTRRAFRTVRRLVSVYLGLSALTMLAALALHTHTDLITPAVWVRGTIVLIGAAVALLLTVRAAGGSRGAFRRLRIVSGAMLVAIAAIIAVPGVFPVWMKIEQGLCGLALAAVAVVINGRRLRTLFARP